MSRHPGMLPVVAALLFAGCAPSGPALSGSVGAIRTGAAQAKTESASAFSAINVTGRESAVEILLDDNAAPSDAALAPLIPPDTSARWNAAFDQIDAELEGIRDAVQARCLAAEDADERQRLGAEYRKVNAHILKLQATGLVIGTEAFGTQVVAIRYAANDIKAAADRLDAMNDVLHGIAGVLGVVDSILKLAARAPVGLA